MSRTEKLNISIRPELKAGLKKLYGGRLISQAFERMAWKEIMSRIDEATEQRAGNLAAVKLYSDSGEAVESVIKTMKHQVDLWESRLKMFEEIKRECFPDGYTFENDDVTEEIKRGEFF